MTADRLPPRVLIIIAQLVARGFLCALRESIESDQDSDLDTKDRNAMSGTLIIRYADYWRIRETWL